MTAISTRLPAVTVEYDWGNNGQRRTKHFKDANAAKTFYAKKEKDGKNPKLVGPNESTSTIKTGETPVVEKPEPTMAATKDKPKAPGVQYKVTRPYLAGTIIKKHGIAAGVTDDMVAELDDAYGKPNPAESKFCLKNAWHASRGFARA